MKRKAVVIKYIRNKDNAPKVVAKGTGFIAEKILELAKKHNIPIVEDEKLISFLINIDIGKEIPPDTYKVVAKILSYVYTIIRPKYLSK
ncbi:MAG: EscU/YscU/HrcU family type III secretion system export apparatus switch protein [Desulfurobacteriaceae bacterium]